MQTDFFSLWMLLLVLLFFAWFGPVPVDVRLLLIAVSFSVPDESNKLNSVFNASPLQIKVGKLVNRRVFRKRNETQFLYPFFLNRHNGSFWTFYLHTRKVFRHMFQQQNGFLWGDDPPTRNSSSSSSTGRRQLTDLRNDRAYFVCILAFL